MVTQKVRKVGNSYVVTIPREELERQHIVEGDMVGIEIRKVQVSLRPEFSPRSLRRCSAPWRSMTWICATWPRASSPAA